jgi:hypothetical protein
VNLSVRLVVAAYLPWRVSSSTSSSLNSMNFSTLQGSPVLGLITSRFKCKISIYYLGGNERISERMGV